MTKEEKWKELRDLVIRWAFGVQYCSVTMRFKALDGCEVIIIAGDAYFAIHKDVRGNTFNRQAGFHKNKNGEVWEWDTRADNWRELK